jgi:hypothetical protein
MLVGSPNFLYFSCSFYFFKLTWWLHSGLWAWYAGALLLDPLCQHFLLVVFDFMCGVDGNTSIYASPLYLG